MRKRPYRNRKHVIGEFMKSKTILITGAGSGLGMFLAKEYAMLGFKVIGIDVNENGLMFGAKDFGLLPIVMSVSQASEWERNVEKINSYCDGEIDICIVNAGILRMGDVMSDMESWDTSVGVNLTGSYLTARFSIPYLFNSKGNIVFIGSSSSIFSAEKELGYISTKHGLVGMMKSISLDYGAIGIRSNMVSPGWMRTAMSDKEMELVMDTKGCTLDEAYDFATAYIPLKRPGMLEEIFNAIYFLSSEKAGFITGVNLLVDGGSSIVDSGMIGVNSLSKKQ